jgi:hypothetical protein
MIFSGYFVSAHPFLSIGRARCKDRFGITAKPARNQQLALDGLYRRSGAPLRVLSPEVRNFYAGQFTSIGN